MQDRRLLIRSKHTSQCGAVRCLRVDSLCNATMGGVTSQPSHQLCAWARIAGVLWPLAAWFAILAPWRAAFGLMQHHEVLHTSWAETCRVTGVVLSGIQLCDLRSQCSKNSLVNTMLKSLNHQDMSCLNADVQIVRQLETAWIRHRRIRYFTK